MDVQLPCLDDYLLNLRANNFSAETSYNYERDLNTFEYFLGHDIEKKFDEIGFNQIIISNFKSGSLNVMLNVRAEN